MPTRVSIPVGPLGFTGKTEVTVKVPLEGAVKVYHKAFGVAEVVPQHNPVPVGYVPVTFPVT